MGNPERVKYAKLNVMEHLAQQVVNKGYFNEDYKLEISFKEEQEDKTLSMKYSAYCKVYKG